MSERVRGWSSKLEIERLYESDFKVGKDFTWDYWDEKNKLCKFMGIGSSTPNMLSYWDESIGHVWVDVSVRCVLRAYELYNLKAPTKSGKVLTREEDVANALVREGFMEYCTQQLVHRFRKTAQTSIARLKGVKYEQYLKNRLKNEVIESVFDKEKIKELIHFGVYDPILPDIIVRYENGNIDIVSCKCFNRTNYRVAIQGDRSAVRPEKNMFQKLHNNEEIKLHDVVLSKNKNTKVRLVIILQSIHKQTPYEAYKIYNNPEELPSHLSFNKKNIEDGVLKIAKWVKTSKQV